MSIQPYLFFDGRCEEAIEFYRKAIGAQLEMLMRYKESPAPPNPATPADFGDKVLHASFRLGDSVVMASDDCTGHPKFAGFSLAITVPTPDEAHKKFAALAEGGSVNMPLTKTFFSPSYGMLVDRFGVHWMVMAAAQ